MTETVFVDTAYWLALVSRKDQFHQAAIHWTDAIGGEMVTTVAVLLETASALARPDRRPHAVALIEAVRDRPDIAVIELDAPLFDDAWGLYRRRADKAWSLVDCVSFEVMRRRKIGAALTSDQHFVQAGYGALLLEDVPC